MKTIALMVTLLAGSMALVSPVHAATPGKNASVLRLAGWSCTYWTINGRSYNYCCRESDGYCTGIYAL
jgi:hypothetical protein